MSGSPPSAFTRQQALTRQQCEDFLQQACTPEAAALIADSASPYGALDPATRDSFACTDPTLCPLWMEIRTHAARLAVEEPLLGSFMFATILNHPTLAKALSYYLAEKLADEHFNMMQWHQLIEQVRV